MQPGAVMQLSKLGTHARIQWSEYTLIYAQFSVLSCVVGKSRAKLGC